MMENKPDKGSFWKRHFFLLPSLTAAVVLLCQQMTSSNPSAGVTVNILLLVLSFFSYVRLLRGAWGEKCRKICSDCCGRLCHTYGICVQSLSGRNPHPFEQHGERGSL